MASCVPWTPDTSCSDDWVNLDPALQERSVALAWSTLRVLSGGMVGNCPVVDRPCLSDTCNVCSVWWMQPSLRNGVWRNHVCGSTDCDCVVLPAVKFPGPVVVLEVVVDGVPLTMDDWILFDWRQLVRSDGGYWPSCADPRLPVDDPGAFAVTYVPGLLPDEGALWAAGLLAVEYAKACTGQKCRLPSSVTSISRQGVSMTLAEGMFSNGLTGIREVDAWLVSVNPNKLLVRPQVWSPDIDRHYSTPDIRAWTP